MDFPTVVSLPATPGPVYAQEASSFEFALLRRIAAMADADPLATVRGFSCQGDSAAKTYSGLFTFARNIAVPDLDIEIPISDARVSCATSPASDAVMALVWADLLSRIEAQAIAFDPDATADVYEVQIAVGGDGAVILIAVLWRLVIPQ